MRVPVVGGPQDGATMILTEDYRVIGLCFWILNGHYDVTFTAESGWELKFND